MADLQVIASQSSNGIYSIMSGSTNWETARQGNGTKTQLDYISATSDVWEGEYYAAQGFLEFDLSGLPPNAAVTSLTLSIYMADLYLDISDAIIVLYQDDSWSYPLQNNHFIPANDLENGIGYIQLLQGHSPGWVDISIDLSQVQLTGTVGRVVLINLAQALTAAPTGMNEAQFLSPHESDPAWRPQLNIVYTTSGTLPAPENFTFVLTPGVREVVGNWDAVGGTAIYDFEVEVWNGSSWVAHWSEWTNLTNFNLTNAFGNIQWNTRYRARVKATPDPPTEGLWTNWVEVLTSLEPGAQDLQIFRYDNGQLVPVEIYRGNL